MSTPFRPDRAYPIPARAEIVAKEGKPYARIIENGRVALYPLSKDGTKYLKPAKKYVAEIRDADGNLKKVSLSTNMDSSRMILTGLLRNVDKERSG